MSREIEREAGTIGPELTPSQEVPMVCQERWEAIRRLAFHERVSIAEIARRLDLNRRTVRRCLRAPTRRPYHRPPRTDTVLAPYLTYLQERAPQVHYSAQILFQELRQQRGYRGGYDTVRLFVRPLRAAALSPDQTIRRFETPPGQQSQIDWGTATVPFRVRPRVVHVFVLTLGFSRRSFDRCFPNETLPQFLDAHEQAFAYFAGHTREHLYDRPRTVCQGSAGGRILWNPTFRAFADYWSFEPRVCQAYRAQTKGKVESGVKYFKGNFLPGRAFVDDVHLDEALRFWLLRVHQIKGAAKTIARICVDLGLLRAQGARAPRRAPRQLKLFEKATPGESVQVDVKVVTVNGTKTYQYTACDDCTRYRVLRLFPRLNARTSIDFLAELRRVLPFSVQKMQTDHGTEFSFAFVLAVHLAGLRHRYIKPRRPQQNGKVERSHRIDNEEFWSRSTFGSFAEAAGALRSWETRYNTERFSMALQGRTPTEKLAAVLGIAA